MAEDHAELHELHIENHELEHHGAGSTIARLEADIVGLRAELDAHMSGPGHHAHSPDEFDVEGELDV